MDEREHSLIQESGLPRLADELERLLLPSIRVHAQAAHEESIGIGPSKIGGAPDLPESVTWPTWKDSPMSFLAQIRLADIAPLDTQALLPHTGLLSFFYDAEGVVFGLDPAEREGWRVLFSQDNNLHRATFPESFPANAQYAPCTVSFTREWTLPDFESPAIERLGLSWGTMYGEESNPSVKEECERYLALSASFDSLFGNRSAINRMLGYPDPVQGNVQAECQYAAHGLYQHAAGDWPSEQAAVLKRDALDWQLLLQLDSLAAAGMMWGDVGRLYFMISRTALAERNFDATWLIMQSS